MIAKIVNLQSGGTVIEPWNVDQLPEEILSVHLGMATELPEMKNGRDAVKARIEAFRKKHPTYRKYNG